MPEPNIDTSSYSGRVGERLRKLCAKSGWNAYKLSAMLTFVGCEVSRRTVVRWLNGTRPVDPDAFPAIAELFGYQTATGWLPKN